ncbi:MAG: transcriptional regulator [Candidatus Bathyarchaeia archaeon]
MSKDQGLGLVLFVISILGLVLYGWFVYGWPLLTLQITAFVAVAGVLLIVAWIGYTMATTPPPAPLQPEPAPEVAEPAGSTSKAEADA